MNVKLRDEVRGTKTIEVVHKSALYASKCDDCAKVFEMQPWCNDTGLAQMRGTFDEHGKHVVDKDGRGLGNSFSATVCSFGCAHAIFTGGWRKMKDCAPFAKADATLARAELKITALVRDEEEIVAAWDTAEEYLPHEGPHIITGTWHFGRPTTVGIERIEDAARALSDLADGVVVQMRQGPQTAFERGRAEGLREAVEILKRMVVER